MAYQPTFSPYMPVDPYMGETEEERRRRLEAEAAAAMPPPAPEPVAPEPVSSTPVKQTITYDPETGEQRMKIEGSVNDLSAANPMTPTVLTPGGDTMAQPPAPVMPEAPAPAPVAQEQRQMPPGVEMVDGKLKLAPIEIGEGVQLAGPMVAGAVQSKNTTGLNAPKLETGTGPTQIPSGMPAPAAAPAAAPATGQNARDDLLARMAPTFESRFAEASDNDAKLATIYNDPNLTKEQKQVVGIALRDQLNKQVGQERAKQELAGMSENDIARLLKSKSEEGSWAKMLLLGFISPDLAGKEAAKLGLNDKWAVGSTQDNKPFLYKTRDGIPIEGYDSTSGKRMGEKELIGAVGAAAGNIDIVGGTYVSDTLKDANGQPLVGRVVSDKKTGQSYIQTDEGRKPMSGFRPQSSGGSLDAQRVAQIQRQNIDLAGDWAKLQMKVQGAAPEAANKFLGEFNAKYRTNYPLSSISGAPPQISMETGQMTTIPAAGITSVAPAVETTGGGGGKATNAGGGGSTTSGRTTNAGGGTTNAGGGGGVRVGGGGGSPADVALNTELRGEAAKKDIQVQGARSESFNKYVDETITPDAINGDSISSTRKQQFELFNRPGVDVGKIFGVANGAGSAPGDQRWTMFRDVLLGKISEPADQIRERAAALGLNREEQSVAVEYAIMNADINSKTLKSTAGSSQVSDAEQKLNQARNVDITKVPMLGGYNAMAQSQFAGDLAKYRGDWATTAKASNTAELERLWRREKDSINKLYLDSARQRVEYITKMGSTSAAIKEGYKLYPVPRYDPTLNNGQGGWINKKPIGSYER